ncbi:MAG: O-antigen ligase family protein [Saprospiraceae bacterium]
MTKPNLDSLFLGEVKSLSKTDLTFISFLIVIGGCIAFFENGLLGLMPMILLVLVYMLRDIRIIFYGIFTILPFSVEYYFEAAGLGLDIPSEPLMLLMTLATIIYATKQKFVLERKIWLDPIFILVFLHLSWILATVLHSQNMLTSAKYFLAKMWYVIPFFFFPLMYFKKSMDFIKVYKILYIFLFISISIVIIRHSLEGFTFASSYDVVRPFFRNHVSYAAISVICLPFVWAFYRMAEKGSSKKKFLAFVLITFVVGIYFSFTRAAILSAIFAFLAYFIFMKKWVKNALMITGGIVIILVSYLAIDNKYLDLTPNFERTITHTQFDNLLEATYKLEDISSMERIYRWMAGVEMIKEKPLVGFGPGTFYQHYKAYSISQFKTYVSDNPDQSGIHNYFLMTLVEQGFLGFIIFVALCVFLLLRAEETCHRLKNDKNFYIVMAISLSFIIILLMNLINDLIETDKVGPFFFINAAGLLFFRYKYKPSTE